MKVAAIITAGGVGKRMGADRPKQYVEIAGLPIIVHTLNRFAEISDIEHIVVVVPPGHVDSFRTEMLDRHLVRRGIAVVSGGEIRQQSVWNGLKAIPDGVDIVLIHDGVRPFVTAQVIRASICAAGKTGACVVAMPLKETVKRVGEMRTVDGTLDRSVLWGAQTPQTFRFPLICRAFEEADKAGFVGTDDAMLVERLGEAVAVVEGDYRNIKITTPEDVVIAEALAKNFSSMVGEDLAGC